MLWCSMRATKQTRIFFAWFNLLCHVKENASCEWKPKLEVQHERYHFSAVMEGGASCCCSRLYCKESFFMNHENTGTQI